MRTAILASLIFALQPAPGFPQSSPPRWSLGSRPLVSIGENMEDTLILGAVSAIRLTTGQIVVASSKNSRVLWFDARGHFVRGFGRRGRGPGEFGPDLSLYGLPGDTIVVHDAANRRFHYIPPNAADTRIEQRGEPRRVVWLYNRILIEHTPAAPAFGQLRTTLTLIPSGKADTLRLGRVTADGLIWLRRHPVSATYDIFDQRGIAIGVIDLPPGFDPYEITDTAVLGRWLDEDDVEHIQLRALARPGTHTSARPQATGSQPYDQDAELSRQSALTGTMRAVLRNLLTANEAFYADHRRYATSVSELAPPQSILSAGVQVTFVWADGQSYAAIASHPSTPVTCVIVLSPSSSVNSSLVCG